MYSLTCHLVHSPAPLFRNSLLCSGFSLHSRTFGSEVCFHRLSRKRITMSTQNHWEHVYQTRSPQQTSWFAPHLQISLDWITQAAPVFSASIIDIGGGESTLVDDLLARNYNEITVLDISETALRRSQTRLAAAAQRVHWVTGSILDASLPPHSYDLWHDRAVFHFLTDPHQRQAYCRQLASALKSGGRIVIATFGPDGPEKCSGLPVMRYSADALKSELGSSFQLVRDTLFEHQTPFGSIQQFLYCEFQYL
jgi:SAM-dependent methyltransferase